MMMTSATSLGVPEHGELGRLLEQAVAALAQRPSLAGRRSCSRPVSAPTNRPSPWRRQLRPQAP
jgi:hypothetical protein